MPPLAISVRATHYNKEHWVTGSLLNWVLLRSQNQVYTSVRISADRWLWWGGYLDLLVSTKSFLILSSLCLEMTALRSLPISRVCKLFSSGLKNALTVILSAGFRLSVWSFTEHFSRGGCRKGLKENCSTFDPRRFLFITKDYKQLLTLSNDWWDWIN